MTEAMKITLSTQPADARWGEKATYSINNDGITLHLNGADDLGLIQRAARKIDGLGIQHVQLSGEGWDVDRCWAFWQGYKAPKVTTSGRKYSHFRGFTGRFSVSQPAKRCSASSRKLLPKPHRFMLTGVSPGRSTQLSPPSSV